MHAVNRKILLGDPCSMAMIHGSPQHPEIHGMVSFYRACGGSLVVAELYQLPSAHGIFVMHIHSDASRPGAAQDAFDDSSVLPSLLSNDGYAWFAVYTNRFSPAQAVGKTIIIHSDSNDRCTQLASGIILA